MNFAPGLPFIAYFKGIVSHPDFDYLSTLVDFNGDLLSAGLYKRTPATIF